MKNKKLKVAGLLLAMVCATQTGFAGDASTYSELNTAIRYNQTPIQLTQNITGANRNLYNIIGDVTTPTVINGGNYSISGTNGNSRYQGFTIGNSNSLVLNNATISGFTTSVNNSGTLTLNNVTLAAASTGANNVFTQSNTGSTTLTGTNTINSALTNNGSITNQGTLTTSGAVTGSGSIENQGTYNVSGNNSGYTGTYNQSTAGSSTTVTGTFFGGESNISNGTLNWNTTSQIPSNAHLVMSGSNTTLNVGNASQSTTLAINSGSSIAAEVATNVHANSNLNVTGTGVYNLSNNDTIDGTLNLTTGTVNVNNGAVAGTLNATGGKLNLNGGTFVVNDKSTIGNNTAVNIASGTLEVQGNVQLNGNDTWTGAVDLKGGNLTVSNRTEANGNGVLKAESGNLTLESGNLTIGSGSSVASAVNTTVKSNSTLNITDGTIAIDTGDTWAGEVKLNGTGTLDYSGVKSGTTSGKLTATKGNLNVNAGELNVASGSSIGGDVQTKVTSTLNVAGGNVELTNNDTVSGTLNLSSGELKLNNATVAGVLNATGGTLNLTDGTFVLNSNSTIADAVTTKIAANKILQVEGTVGLNDNDDWLGIVNLKQGGTLNVSGRAANKGNGQLVAEDGTLNLNSGNLTIGSGSSIADAVTTKIAGNLNVTDGTVNINNNDTWTGTVNLNSTNGTGTLNYSGLKDGATNGKLVAKNGKLNVKAGTLEVVGGSSIASAVETTIDNGSKLKVSGNTTSNGTVTLDGTDNWNGEIELSGGKLTLDDIKSSTTAILNANSGTIDLVNGTLVVNSGSTIASAVTTNVKTGTTLDVSGDVTIDGTDTWAGTVNLNNGGNLTVTGRTEAQGNGVLNAQGGSLNLASGNLTIGTGSAIADGVEANLAGNLKITEGSVNIGTDDVWSGTVNLNGTAGSLDFNGTKDSTNGKLVAGNGTLNINDGTLNIAGGSKIDTNVNTTITSTLNVNGGNVTLDNNDTWTGEVTLASGNLTLSNVKPNNGKLTAEGGKLNLAAGELTIASGSSIGSAVEATIGKNTILNVAGGTVDLGNEDTWNGTGKVNVTDGTLNINITDNGGNGIITASGGTVNLGSGTLNLAAGSELESGATLNLANATITNVSGGGITLDANDSWDKNATVNLSSGNVTIDGLTSNGTFVAKGGDVAINSGKLTIEGDSNIEGANEVAIDTNGSLVLKKNTTVNKITGDGNLTLDNKSTLTFDNNSVFSDDLQFVSQGSSTVYIKSNADSVLNVVTGDKANNTGLTITIDGTDATNALNIDGTHISNLNFLNTVKYSGALTNNGTTSNTGDLTLSGVITGSGQFNNSNKVTLTSDASGFDGTYTQTAGSTKVTSAGKVFGGTKNINGGSLNITSADAIDYTDVNLGNGASLTHTIQTADKNVVNSDVVKFTGSNATATFKADDGVKANIELGSNITGDGSGNKVVFDNINNLTLGRTDYTGQTEYKLINGTDLNLIEKGEEAANNDYSFAHLTTDGSATLSFNVKIVDGETVGTKALETDTLTIGGNTDTIFNFGNIYITGEENGNTGLYETKKDVLTGGHFVGQPDDKNITYATGATTSWVYDVKSANDGHSISMQIKDFVDEHTLYTMNATEGTRFFQFSNDGSGKTEIYHIDQSLSATEGQRDGVGSQASFTVTGNGMNLSTISGEIYDKTTHQSTGERGSFFNIASGEDVKLDIKNVTIQEAEKTGNGSVVENNSEKAIVTMTGVKVDDTHSTGNGGAIYNGVMNEDAAKSNLIIANSILSNNSAGGNGGAIYNAGNMAVSGTTFTDNAAAQGGAIWNGGKMTLTNVTVNAATDTAANDIYQASSGETILIGTNTIASDIAGEGSITNNGVLNISGDNSGYTGTFTQDNDGTTTVTNKFFAGKSTIKNGTLNWFTENDIKEDAKLTVEKGTLNIGKDTDKKGVLSIGNGSSVAADVKMTINKVSTLNVVDKGNVTINSNDIWAGNVTLADGGKLAIDGYKKANGALTATNGELKITNSTIAIATGSSIANAVKTTIDKDTTINITGGNVTLDGATGDDWSGKIVMTDGDLTVDNVTSNGIIQASGGNVTLVENGNLVIEKDSFITEGVTVDLQTGTTTTVKNNTKDAGLALNKGDKWAGTVKVEKGGLLTVNKIDSNNKLLAEDGTVNLIAGNLVIENGSEIKQAVATTINKDAVLDIRKDGLVELDGANDSWLGEIKITDGQLDLDGMKSNNKLTATDGGVINLKSGNLDITKGSVIAGNNESGGSTSINIAKDTNLNILGGDVTINDNDTWEGFVNLKDGTLNIEQKTEGILHADGGNLNFTTGTLTIKDGSYIELDVKVNLPENSLIEILKGGTVAINDNDIWDGEILLNGGVLNYGTTHSGTLTANTGDMNLLDGSILNIQIPSQVADEVNVDIRKGALVNLKEDAIFNLDSKDKWNGMINNAGGKLTTTNLTNSTGEGGGLQQTAGSSTFQDNSHIYISDANSYLTGGDVNILNNSSLWMGAATAELKVDNLKLAQNSTLDMMNDKINTSTAGNMIVNDRNNVTINISPRDWKHDKFIINNLKSDSEGTINVSNFDFLGLCPIDRHLKFKVFDAQTISNVKFDATDKQIFTPIGWYDLQAAGGGYYTSNLTKYNPQVFRGQVATMAMWNNQLAIDDMLLNHVSLSSERLLAQGSNANRYAINESQFAPYQYRKEDGGLWFKSYANFETLSMTQGLNVHNNSYGSIVGADFPVVNMKRGWKFMPTAYVGYNGSHQSFNGVGMYQNGGQAGFMGTFMKDDFIGSVLAYGGGYNNEMSVAGYTDRTGNWFAGAAAKAAYNLHATKHFTVQPTMMLAYNIFGRQNWGTDFGTMGMSSGYLNGINIAPGVNFIYARETWNMYATIQYMYNINDHIDGRAGNVSLSNVDMRHGYLQYGVGVNKTWKDRLTSYFQIVFRNGGRTGVGFQLGAQYLFDWFKPKSKKIEKVQTQPDKTQIKSLSMK